MVLWYCTLHSFTVFKQNVIVQFLTSTHLTSESKERSMFDKWTTLFLSQKRAKKVSCQTGSFSRGAEGVCSKAEVWLDQSGSQQDVCERVVLYLQHTSCGQVVRYLHYPGESGSTREQCRVSSSSPQGSRDQNSWQPINMATDVLVRQHTIGYTMDASSA